ncbi:MAG TPA: HEAT repeat domain-containing protein [Thiobacillaceae bacterium]|nr:HEAT repeat domain-containing protein [Thiobacillaceae bacterium]HNU63397.1 HEAT repeat domain-containing protein [Thiobacillaceae bacterium]
MPADALLFLSSHCPHCPAMLRGLGELLKRGVIGRLEAVNLEVWPDAGVALGVRSVPWLRLGPFVLTGARASVELETWARRAESPAGMADALHELLKTGDLPQVLDLVSRDATRLAALLPIVANPEASMNVRVGAGAVLEEYAGSTVLASLVPELGALTRHADARVRADACHYLGLSRQAEARMWIESCLADTSTEVREIAAEALENLG